MSQYVKKESNITRLRHCGCVSIFGTCPEYLREISMEFYKEK
jgi:hypothetical protein